MQNSGEPHVIVISDEVEKAARHPAGSRQELSAKLWVDWLTHRWQRQLGSGNVQDDPVIDYAQLVQRALALRSAPHHTADVLTHQWWRMMGRYCTEDSVILRNPPVDG